MRTVLTLHTKAANRKFCEYSTGIWQPARLSAPVPGWNGRKDQRQSIELFKEEKHRREARDDCGLEHSSMSVALSEGLHECWQQRLVPN